MAAQRRRTPDPELRPRFPGACGVHPAVVYIGEEPTSIRTEAAIFETIFRGRSPNALGCGRLIDMDFRISSRKMGSAKSNPSTIRADTARPYALAGVHPARRGRVRMQDPAAGMSSHAVAAPHRLGDNSTFTTDRDLAIWLPRLPGKRNAAPRPYARTSSVPSAAARSVRRSRWWPRPIISCVSYGRC